MTGIDENRLRDKSIEIPATQVFDRRKGQFKAQEENPYHLRRIGSAW